MAYEIPRRAQGVVRSAGQTPLTLRYLHAAMTSLVALALLIEGFRLAREPGFSVGGLAAGTAIAVGGLALIFGVGWLYAIARDRR
jgi:hypothetical protein